MRTNHNRPKVGVGILIFKDGNVLLGKRIGSHGAQEYAGPGGHLEHMESMEECIRREVLEEAGVNIKNIEFLCLSNLKGYAPKHYVDIGFTAEWCGGKVENREPEKRESWGWFDLSNIPQPLFAATKNYIEALTTGKTLFDE